MSASTTPLPAPVRGVYPLSYARAWLNERLGLAGLCRADVIRRGPSDHWAIVVELNLRDAS